MDKLRNILRLPNTEDIDLDDPQAADLHHQIIKSKSFLQSIYKEWYALLTHSLPTNLGPTLEIGSGSGFFSADENLTISSDIRKITGIDLVCDAHQLPFCDNSFGGIVMTNVLHHFHKPYLFLIEADRCLVENGVLAMIEPWNSPWSEFIYKRFHHEVFNPGQMNWDAGVSTPLSTANGAIPWIIFQRDRIVMEDKLPRLFIQKIQPMMPIAYLFSGGLSIKSIMPGYAYTSIRKVEYMLQAIMPTMGMFALIVIKKYRE